MSKSNAGKDDTDEALVAENSVYESEHVVGENNVEIMSK